MLESLLAEACPRRPHRCGRASRRPASVRSPATPGSCAAPGAPGWALVGDAGYWKDPLIAHGLTDALRDAELLARAAVAAASGDVSEADAFADYQDTRDRLSLPLFEITDAIASQRWSDTEIARSCSR